LYKLFLQVLILLIFVGSGGGRVSAFEPADFTVKSVAVMEYDEKGDPLKYPRHIFYDKINHETYVVVSGARELTIFTSDFYPVISFGHGRGLRGIAGGYAGPEKLLFCLGGSLEPASTLEVYDRALLPAGRLELKGFAEVDSFRPQQAVFQNGFFYVVGFHSQGLLIFDSEGVFRSRIIPRDQVLGVEEEAVVSSFTLDSKGRLYLLSEELGRIFVYSSARKLLFKFGTKGGSSGKLSRPRFLVLDEEMGLILVVDYMRHAVNVYNMAGEYLFEFGGKGHGRGWFSFPSDMTIDDRGRIWVADTFNDRVQVFKIIHREPGSIQKSVPESGPLLESPRIAGSLKVPEVQESDPGDHFPESSLLPETPLNPDEVQESDL
jgi:hypothetical protein